MAEHFGPWPTNTAGPRQTTALTEAINALRHEATTHDDLSGVIGRDEATIAVWTPFSAPRADVVELDEKIRADFDHTVTRTNVRAIIAAYTAALPEARASRPTVDNRTTPDQAAADNAAAARHAAKHRAQREAEAALLNQVMAKAPAGASALIVAEYHEDASDPLSDYASSRITRTIAIGYRTTRRESFPALRAAARRNPETSHLASQDALDAWTSDHEHRLTGTNQLEHRDNYSLGRGNYLSDHGTASSGTGWVVRSIAFPCRLAHLTEDAIPTHTGAAATAAPAHVGAEPRTPSPGSP